MGNKYTQVNFFCLTSQISISCEAQFLKKEKIVIENKLSKNKEFFLVELAKNEYEKKMCVIIFAWKIRNEKNLWIEKSQ